MKLGFIGAGRVGTGLGTAFGRSGHPVVAIASRTDGAALRLARRLPGARACGPQEVVAMADLVFLTVPDDAIESVAAGLAWRPGVACVHCSGAAELDVLRKAAGDGAETGGFHPLHMFGDPDAEADSLSGTSVALAGPDTLVRKLEGLARSVGARPFRLPEGSRALYHASANFVGAFVVALIDEALELWRRLGVPEREAMTALLPLLRGTVDGVEKAGTAGALGSAVARGDLGTIRRHLDALAQQAPESLEIYRLLSLRTVPIALAKGTLRPEIARAIEALLRDLRV